ncbi:unnamed protein product [Tenebrio molitor]|nr:unnamed protein product [Tenebrio molitor]
MTEEKEAQKRNYDNSYYHQHHQQPSPLKPTTKQLRSSVEAKGIRKNV